MSGDSRMWLIRMEVGHGPPPWQHHDHLLRWQFPHSLLGDAATCRSSSILRWTYSRTICKVSLFNLAICKVSFCKSAICMQSFWSYCWHFATLCLLLSMVMMGWSYMVGLTGLGPTRCGGGWFPHSRDSVTECYWWDDYESDFMLCHYYDTWYVTWQSFLYCDQLGSVLREHLLRGDLLLGVLLPCNGL